jgi:DNA-binding beta-propeller fold protein YncE
MSHPQLSQQTSGHLRSANRRTRLLTGLAALLALAILTAFTAPHAAAIGDEEELSQFGSVGSGAGQLNAPRGIATDPVTGHLYTSDEGNNRINEFTPWGNFVKAFGWDVAPGAVNEQQEVRVRAASGQFKLTFGASTTGDLAFDAPGSESEGPGSVEAALNALPSIGEVNVEAVPGTPDGKTPFIYVIAFKGSMAGTNVAELTIANGTTPLSGGVPSSTLEVRTRADGTPGGMGLESCTEESSCKAGVQGFGAGQFALAQGGVAVDAAGNVYVREVKSDNRRVQKFDSAGRFLLMFGGEVNKTTSENRCTKAQLEGGDVCGAGEIGNGGGQFREGSSRGITLDSAGKLFVGDVERIQRFNSEGEWEASVPVSGKTIHFLAIAPSSGDFYATVGPPNGTEQHVRILDATTGAETGQLKGTGGAQEAVATDFAGNVFAKDGNQVLQWDSKGKPLSPPSCCKADIEVGGLATNAIGDLYVAYSVFGESFIRSFGPAPVSFEGAPPVPPEIVGQFASSVDRTSAVLRAEINPHFWTDTRYYLQYGTGECSEEGCTETKPVPPGALLTAKVTDDLVKSAGIAIEGLKPGTTYHYRFVAESSGGGPVRGVGGEVGLDGEESAFITYPVSAPAKTDCPNQAFRIGFSAPLADCRAYEMVSPVDKNNGDIKALLDIPSYRTSLSQSALDGERFTYSSYRGFGDLQAAPYANQYLASREDGVGWSSESLDPAQITGFESNSFENHHKAFSADLCTSWMMVNAEPVLAPGATQGFNNLYRRENCGKEGYEALIGVEPSFRGFYPVLQGTSADGKEAILMAKDKLTEDAASGTWQTYYASEGGLHLVCVLPDGAPNGGNCSGGTTLQSSELPELERWTSQSHAISLDGSKVYWTDLGGKVFLASAGKVYLRLNPGEEQSALIGGECTEAEKACTLKVSETKTSQPSHFFGASADGAKALFEVAAGALTGDLYKFDSETASSVKLAGDVLGVAAMSENLSRVYFVSEEVLPETSGATAGKPNLYLDEEGTKTFIATISKTDTVKDDSSNAAPEPIWHAARTTADGRVLAFFSTESLTGYDNTDLVSGRADAEVYLYEAGSAGPVCASCNPSGGRPSGRAVGREPGVPTAASLPLPENALYSPRVLSADGGRLFFNSFDALLPRDTNGKGDVYEWQAASGQKQCDEKGAELYVPSSDGCISLISSGQSPQDSALLDIGANGNDVFFTTNASLLPQDPGLIDVYDARAGGGLPAPPEPPGPCQGEACQLAPPPPNDPTPASASFKGAGNLSAKPRARCAKGKARRRGRCVAKKSKRAKKANQRKRDASANRKAGR